MAKIDISGLDKAGVLAALYNASKPQGRGFQHFVDDDMTIEQARKIIEGGYLRFDYLQGRVMKIDLSEDTLEPGGYDRDNGEGAAERAINSYRETNKPSNAVIRKAHAEGTRASLDVVNTSLSKPRPEPQVEGNLLKLTLSLHEVEDQLRPTLDKAAEIHEKSAEFVNAKFWYRVKLRPFSDEAQHLAGRLVYAEKVNGENVTVLLAASFEAKSGASITILKEDLTDHN